MQYEDLNADGVRESPGLLLEGSTVIKSRYSQDFTNWTATGTPTLGATLSLGVLSIRQVTDDDGAASEYHTRSYGASALFVGNGVKGVCIYVSKGASPPASGSRVQINDSTAVATRLSAIITWSGTTPSVNMAGGGTLLRQQQVGVVGSAIIWRLDFQTLSVIAANNHDVLLIPASTASDTGDIYWGGFQADSALAFPSSYCVTTNADVTRAADSLTLPFNFGPMDTTVLYRMARPVWADAVGDIGFFPSLVDISTANPRYEVFFNQTTRQFNARSGDAGSGAAANISAGASLVFTSQHKNAATLPAVAVDVGSGLTAFDTGAAAFTSFANQTIRPSNPIVGLYGVLLDLKGRAGLATLTEMGTEPAFAPVNPFEVSDFNLPGPLISKAQSGRVNTRSTQQIGRTWTEHYLLQVTQVAHREFLSRIKNLWRNGTIFAHSHIDYLTPKGSAGGFPLVKGAAQTGSTLIVDGCPLNTANWLRAGDIFRVQGLPQAFEAAADVNTEGDGRALIPLVVPIFTGGSPADNATLTVTGVTLDVVLLEPPDFPTTSGRGADWGEVTLKLSEAL